MDSIKKDMNKLDTSILNKSQPNIIVENEFLNKQPNIVVENDFLTPKTNHVPQEDQMVNEKKKYDNFNDATKMRKETIERQKQARGVNDIPNEGVIIPINLDFNRIATSAKNAENEKFITVGHPEYWGDNGNLNYKIDGNVVQIYEGDTILGFTDLKGIKIINNKSINNDIDNNKKQVATLSDKHFSPIEPPINNESSYNKNNEETKIAQLGENLRPIEPPISNTSMTSSQLGENLRPIEPPINEKSSYENKTVNNVLNDKKLNYYTQECRDIAEEGIKRGWTEEQIEIAIGISKFTTGGYKMNSYTDNNNYGGMIDVNGEPAKYNTKEEGLKAYIDKIDLYYKSGNNTIDKVVNKYYKFDSETEKQNIIKLLSKTIENEKIKEYKYAFSNDIAKAAAERGWSKDKIDLAVGISRYETGDYSDYKAKDYYNFGGLRRGQGVKPIGYSKNGFALFASKEEGINSFLNTLESYYDSGRTTPEQIVKKYCPNSDGNDEAHWVKCVYAKIANEKTT